REPRLYAMGMGGWDKPLPQMLKRLGWRMCEVPFYFKVLHPYRFLRNIRALRTSALRKLALDAAAFTGAGWAGMRILGIAGRTRGPAEAEGRQEAESLTAGLVARASRPALIPFFESWADKTWESARSACVLAGRRDSATLQALYPDSDSRFLRVRA